MIDSGILRLAKFEEAKDYWLGKLDGELCETVLSSIYSGEDSNQVQDARLQIPGGLSKQLLEMANGQDIGIFVIVLSVFKLWLHALTGTRDSIVVSPVLAKSKQQYNRWLVLRDTIETSLPFKEFLGGVKQTLSSAVRYQYYPIEKLLELLDIESDLSLFRVLFSMDSLHREWSAEDLLEHQKNDLTVTLSTDNGALACSFSFTSLAVDAEIWGYWQTCFLDILGQVLDHVDIPVEDILWVKNEESLKILKQFSQTEAVAHPTGESELLHQLLEKQATCHPQRMALQYMDQRGEWKDISYGRLNHMASNVAAVLMEKGVGRGEIVAILLSDPVAVIVSIFAVLKARGAYLPIEPNYPAARISFMLKDSNARLVMTAKEIAFPDIEIPGGDCFHPELLFYEDVDFQSSDVAPRTSKVTAKDPAYVIYTSGTTGVPKGVIVEHGSVTPKLLARKEDYQLDETCGALQLFSHAFDGFITSFFTPIAAGSRVVLLPVGKTADIPFVREAIKSAAVTHLICVPPLFALIVDGGAPEALSSLKIVTLAGDRLSMELVQKAASALPNLEIAHEYGVTEASVVSTLLRHQETRPRISIGRPFSETNLLIVDSNNLAKVVPIGVPGEIAVGGNGVARGYLNRPQLTRERFIEHPAIYGERVYLTGDLGRFLADGAIEFLGRADHQVKIRGNRVEIGEVEGRLRCHEAVADVVVDVVDSVDGQLELCAYIVAAEALDATELKNYLADYLPAPMIPSVFVSVDVIPLTATGKVDRAALPKPRRTRAGFDTPFVPPANDTEEAIAGVWARVLGIDSIGVSDNIIDLGGNSINMVKITHTLNDELNLALPVATLFQYPTVRSLSRFILSSTTEKDAEAVDTVSGDSKIAIIGMAGRFPGAVDIDSFWDNIKGGVESIVFATEDELIDAGLEEEMVRHPAFVTCRGGLLDDKEYFDALFFGYTPREAELLDPQVRILHEVAWHALEHAGYDSFSFSGSIGIFAGASSHFHWHAVSLISGKSREIGHFTASQLTDKDFLCTRLAFKLNLSGPAVTLQTSCSTSLVATHMACRSILSGECSMALAGGVSVSAEEHLGYMYQDNMILSKDGHCRAFDSEASGIVGGEGAGMIVLKSLSAAREEGDYIHAVILASAINNDGNNKAGFTAPGVQGQVDVIKKTMRAATVEPETISYIEAHGTGTSIGDPIEIESLIQAFSTKKTGFCGIGSVKTNIGHLDTAAGVAGLIKTVMSLEDRLLAPSLHFNIPNPRINFESSPFYVNRELHAWGEPDQVLRAGISSFGIGGTNAHIILEQAPLEQRESQENNDLQPCVLVLSAQSLKALDQATLELATHMVRKPDVRLEDIAFTLQVGRSSKSHRRMVCCSTRRQALDALTGQEGVRPATFHSTAEDRPVFFVFPGLGSQYRGMARELGQREPIFRKELERCCRKCSTLGIDIASEFFSSATNDELDVHDFEIAQAMMFSVQFSLAHLLIEWGIQPRGMIGYSFGEYTAAAVAGVMTPEEALELIIARGRLVKSCSEGAMLSVPLPKKQARKFLTSNTAVAIDNGSSCVLSGPVNEIDGIMNRLKGDRLFATPIQTGRAIHSPMMEPILDKFLLKCEKVLFKSPTIPYISNVTGKWLKRGEAPEPGYWVDHLRQTVQFSNGIDNLIEKDDALFLEVGPGTDITALLRRRLPEEAKRFALNMMRPEMNHMDDGTYLLNKIGQLWLYGQSIDWNSVFAGRDRRRVPLPGYPFQRERFWIDNSVLEEANQPVVQQKGILKKEKVDEWFYWPQWQRAAKLPKIKNHGVRNSRWLVFADSGTVGEEIAFHLRDLGAVAVMVKKGEDFFSAGDHDFTIDPRDKEHYIELFKELKNRSLTPDRVIHAFTALNTDCGLDLGFYSVLYLAKALAMEDEVNEAMLYMLTSGAFDVDRDEAVNPFNAALLGPAKVIPQEYPHLRTRVVDVEESNPDLLIQEFMYNCTDIAVIYRNHRRWRQVVEPACFPKPTDGDSLLRQKGVYLVTGGLGNIGYILSSHLAKEWQADLILVSRTSSASRVEKVRELERAGVRVIVAAADVADGRALEEIISEAEQELGPINGIIHAAGFVGEGSVKTIDQIDDSDCNQHFLPKIDGTLSIRRLAETRDLDFCLLTSSLSPVLGGVGFAAYAASNAVMDLMAHAFGKDSSAHWLSVNWADWRFDTPQSQQSLSYIGGEGLTLAMFPDEGIDTFQRILSHCTERQVIVSAGDLQARIDRWVRLESLHREDDNDSRDSKKYYERPPLATAFRGAKSETEITLASIWKQFFGFRDIGVDDNFFELGGDSLSAINMMARIHKELNVVVPLQEFFHHPTIAGLANQLTRSCAKQHTGIPISEKKEYYPLSSAQMRLNILQQLDPSGTGYNQRQAVKVDGHLDVTLLGAAFSMLIDRHESLRTSIRVLGDMPVQVIHTTVDFAIDFMKTSKRDVDNLIKGFIQPFDFEKPPFFRVRLIRLSPNEHVLVLDMHHIITDGISIGLFMKELMTIYQGRTLTAPRIQYRDYSEWQQSEERTREMEAQQAFWLETFSGQLPVLQLPTDFPRPAMQSFEGRAVQFQLSEEQSRGLKTLAQQEGLTLYMVVLALVNIWLSILSRQEDIVVGTPVAGRGHADLELVIGMLVNTLAMRNFPKPDTTARQFLREVGERSLLAFDNQDYQFEDLVESIDLPRDTSRNPLFDVKLAMQNVERVSLDVAGLVMAPFGNEITSAKFDLGLDVEDLDGFLRFTVEYCTALFDASSIELFIDYFKGVTERVLNNPEARIGDLRYLSEKHKRTILEEFNDTKKSFPSDIPIHHWLEQSAERLPNRTAIVFEDHWLSYDFVAMQARSLAAYLQDVARIKPEQPIALLMQRNIRLLPAIFGVLMAGGVYLPLDPNLPEERNRLLLSDAAVEIIVSQEAFFQTANRLKENSSVVRKVLSIEAKDVMPCEDLGNQWREPLRAVDAGNLAYIIYTSGSTGTPKGVMIEHRPVINRISWMQRFEPLDESDVILQKTPLVFDVSIWELFWWSMAGVRVCLLGPGLEKDPAAMIDIIRNVGVTTMHFVPSMMQAFMEYCASSESAPGLSSLCRVFASGEALKPAHCHKFRQLFTRRNNTRLINLYGPTEATVDVSYFDCTEPYPRGIVPIGAPIDNIKLLVMNRNSQLQGLGIPGELCIAGAGLARGYLNRLDQTDDSFPRHPLLQGDRIYRTGDLARFLEDGNIEFLGRIDHQVKIRGFRIELGEIERCLARLGGFEEAIVLLKHDFTGDPYLVAFVKGDPASDTSSVSDSIKLELPSYMVPSSITVLTDIPLTANGKIDRKALLAKATIEEAASGPEPMDELELLLVDVWSSVLGKDPSLFTVSDNFFAIGGHSLKAITMLSRVHKEFDVDIPLSVFFKIPSIQGLSSYIRGAGKEKYSAIQPVEKMDYYPMSSAQTRIYFLQQVAPESTAYNMPETIILEQEPDWGRLRSAFMSLIRRHETLRTSFPVVAGDPVQRVHDTVNFELEIHDEETRLTDLVRPFNLSNVPLLRVAAVKIKDGGWMLLVDLHHIVSDGVSHEIFEKDFHSYYQGEILQPLTIQYKDYCQWQHSYTERESSKKQGEYWLNKFSGDIPLIRIPTDFPRPAILDFAGDSVLFEIDSPVTASLRRLNSQEGCTMFMTLLTGYSILLAKIASQEELVVGTPVAGRRHSDLERVMGMFVNSLAMRLSPAGGKKVLEYIQEVRDRTIDAFENQDYPFEDLVEMTNVKRDTSRNPIFDVMFAFHNTKEFEYELLDWGRNSEEEAGVHYSNKTSKFDITLTGLEAGGCLYFRLQYNTRLFHKETIKRFGNYFKKVVEGMVSPSISTIDEIELIDQGTRDRLLAGLGKNKRGDNNSSKSSREAQKQTMEADFDF